MFKWLHTEESLTALRAAAGAVKRKDARRLFHNAALRKQRTEISDRWVNGLVPLYGRCKTSTDPRSKSVPAVEIPHRLSGK